jgi:protein-L-isoaspartate(D-aspartate) O-methyltransferase
MHLTRSTAAPPPRVPAADRPASVRRLGGAVTRALAWALACAAPLAGCARQPPADAAPGDSAAARAASGPTAGEFREARRRMVERQLRGAGIRDPRVLGAMGRVPRHRFVPPEAVPAAYDDTPLPIGLGQTISQPYIVAFMTQAARVAPGDTVLEIGTGSGYQAAVLAELAGAVYSIEIVPELAARARATLEALGYANVHLRAGDGYRGWPEHAPYDAIVVTAAPDHVPPALVAQLAPGGRLVIPVGVGEQELLVISRDARGVTTRRTIPVRFVPFTGEAARDSG